MDHAGGSCAQDARPCIVTDFVKRGETGRKRRSSSVCALLSSVDGRGNVMRLRRVKALRIADRTWSFGGSEVRRAFSRYSSEVML